MDSTIISDMKSDELLYAAAASRLAARSATIKFDDIWGGAYANVWAKITENGDGTVTIEMWNDGLADLRGFFMDFNNEGALAGLQIKGMDVTGRTIGDDSVKTVSGQSSVNLNGDVLKAAGGGFDAAIAFGTEGAGFDFITRTSFVLSSTSGALTLDSFAGALLGVRETSVTVVNADGTTTSGLSTKIGEWISKDIFDAKADTISVLEDTVTEHNVFANDAGAATATVTQWYVNGIPLKGNVYVDGRTGIVFTFNANGTITIDTTKADQLAAGETLAFNFAYEAKATDGADTTTTFSDSATVAVKVEGVNDKAELTPIDATGVENEALAVNLNDHARDVDRGDTLAFGVENATASVYDAKGNLLYTKEVMDLVKIDAATGEMIVDTNAELVDSLNDGETMVLDGKWTATDRSGETASSSFSFKIAGVTDNHAPVLLNPALEVTETGVLGITQDQLAFDEDGDALTLYINGKAVAAGEVIELASGALLTVEKDGSLSYSANGRFNYLHEGESATDTFSYAVSDGKVMTESAAATINIIGERTAVVANADFIKTDASLFGAANLYANDRVNEFSAIMGDHSNAQIFTGAMIMSGDILGSFSLLHDGRSSAGIQVATMLTNPEKQAAMISLAESNSDATSTLGVLNMNGLGSNISTVAMSVSGAGGSGATGALGIQTSDGANLWAEGNATASSAYAVSIGVTEAQISGAATGDGTAADGINVSANGIAEGIDNRVLSSAEAETANTDGGLSAAHVSASGAAADGTYVIEAASSLFSQINGALALTDSVSQIGATISSDGFAMFMNQMQNSMTQTSKDARAMTMQNANTNTFYDEASGQFYAAADLQDGVAAMTRDAASTALGAASASISDSGDATQIATDVQAMESVRGDSSDAASTVEASADLYDSGDLTVVDTSLSEQIAGSVGTASVAGIVDASAGAYDSSAYSVSIQEMANVQGLADTSDAVMLDASASLVELTADGALAQAETNTQALLGSEESGSVAAKQELAAFTFGDAKGSFFGVAASGALADAKGQFIMFNFKADDTPYIFSADAALDKSILTLEGLQNTTSIITQTKLGFIVAADLISGRLEIGGNVAAELGYSGADYQASLLNNLADLGAVGSVVQDDTLFGYITTDALYGLYSDSGYYETASAMLTIEHTVQNVGPVAVADTVNFDMASGRAVFNIANLLGNDSDRNAAFGDTFSLASLNGVDARAFGDDTYTSDLSASRAAGGGSSATQNGGQIYLDAAGNVYFQAALNADGSGYINDIFEYEIVDSYGARATAIVNLIGEGIGSGDLATGELVSSQLEARDVWTS